MDQRFGFDCYSPKEIAERIEEGGVAKAGLPMVSQVVLGLLAGGFIGLGAMFFTFIVSDPVLGFVGARVLGGVAFSLGLILVVVAGAELFTGNNLLVMAAVAGRISIRQFLQSMLIVYSANLMGALGLVVVVALSNSWKSGDLAVGKTAVSIAAAKCALPFAEAFFKGVICNVLVCLAIWLAMAGRSVTDKISAIIFPISAFVACGYEHSVANMYFIPLGIWLRGLLPLGGIAHLDMLTWAGFLHNLLPVTLGNLVGGAGLVGLVYHVVYRRGAARDQAAQIPSAKFQQNTDKMR